MIILLIYVALFAGAFFAVRSVAGFLTHKQDFTSLKTVTFGDESAVEPSRAASVLSILAIFLIWGAFTNSSLTPVHAPGPFTGTSSFTYTLQAADGKTDEATVHVLVQKEDGTEKLGEIAPGDGFAKDDGAEVRAWRSELLRVDSNDDLGRGDGAKIIAVDGKAIEPGKEVAVASGVVAMTPRGSLNYRPDSGWQMEPVWLPSPEKVWARFIETMHNGYQNFSLFEHLYWSLYRVLIGFVLGALVGIPLGYAMGLSNWFRGWFDPIVEFMRPVPPLALIPLVIIWAGIGESGKIILLFLAALWIMAIAARAGASGVNISKVHAAYSLGASKWQILRHVIIPNSLPEIFTGARVAMGVCWGTVVAAELVAAEKGAGMMIMVASRFQLTDLVIMGILLIGVIGFGIDVLMRKAESWLIPWKGKS
jgi:taurine transport system permease protein